MKKEDLPDLLPVEFTELFIVKNEINTKDWADYRQFIESLRKKQQLIHSRTGNDFPILHPEAYPPIFDHWFHIKLTAGNDMHLIPGGNIVTLRIRRSNVYLDGYRNKMGKWFEFGRDRDMHLIPGSTFLGFYGDYNSLENAAGQKREAIKLGRKQLEEAVNKLASFENRQVIAQALIVVIQMMCESTRFQSISQQLATKFQDQPDDGKDYPDKAEVPPEWMRAQETSWEHISKELLHVDSDPTHSFVPPDPKTNIKTASDAWKAIGMLKNKFPGPLE